MREIPLLSSVNCFLLVLHSMNIRLMLDGLKDREGRNRKSSKNWIVFVSARKEVAGPLNWVSDPDIKPGYIYVVAYITGYEEGIDYTYNWKLEIYPVTRPVQCPPVGQGPRSPNAAHANAMAALGVQLSHMQISEVMSSSSRVWTFAVNATAFTNMRSSACIPVDMVQCYTSTQHKDWDQMCSEGARMWYNLTAKDPSQLWGYGEKVEYIQVRVLGHMYIQKDEVIFYFKRCARENQGARESVCVEWERQQLVCPDEDNSEDTREGKCNCLRTCARR